MDLIVDANVLFSALIKEGATKELIFNENFHLFSPEFLFEEFSKYRDYILKKAKRTEKEFNSILEALEQIITIIPKEEFQSFLNKASSICPDKDDIAYFALALKLNCSIWSNEKKLKEQDTVPVYSTEDLVKLFLR